jgi:hypothetical protein
VVRKVIAFLAQNVRGRGFRAAKGEPCELIAQPQPGIWLVFVRDLHGHDRATYLKTECLIPDPSPDLRLEDA